MSCSALAGARDGNRWVGCKAKTAAACGECQGSIEVGVSVSRINVSHQSDLGPISSHQSGSDAICMMFTISRVDSTAWARYRKLIIAAA